jgi:hypothetical protein
MKALPIYVYSNGSNCSNHGITEKYDRLLLIHEEGFIDIDENNLPENLVKVVTRDLFNGEYKHIEPYKKATGIGYMNGGCIAFSSDSRFRNISRYPLMIHDRQESQSEYETYSR